MDDDHPSSDLSSEADYDYDYGPDDEPLPAVRAEEIDPEYVVYKCYKQDEVVRILNEEVHKQAQRCKIAEDEAIFFLQKYNFDSNKLAADLQKQGHSLFVQCNLRSEVLPRKKFKKASSYSTSEGTSNASPGLCRICFIQNDNMRSLQCGHEFCKCCWTEYFSNMLVKGISSKIECMESKCKIQCLSSFVSEMLQERQTQLKLYLDRVIRDSILAHPYFRYCPGTDCQGIIYCESQKSHRVTCTFCKTSFCVHCGFDYHVPSSCEIMGRWRKKCGDDSETANYIRANTKDCPKCSACIEKNGGCNHMQCSRCDYHFCWMCFKDWKSHGSEYYECSRYKENPAVALEAKYLKARLDLKKYLHYYERFDNHSKSLKLEEELRTKLICKIEQKVEQHEGTWIDWQYLHDAASLLTKCRYTLQYTYPFAYYLEPGQRKELFEYQQAQLEKEIEELSWKVERAESTDRADLEKQMHVAECKRRTLLQDFLS